MTKAIQPFLKRFADALQVINEIAQTLHHAHTLQQIAQHSAETLHKYSESPLVAFFLLNSEQQRLERLAQAGFSENVLRISATLPLHGSISGCTIAERDLIFCPNIRTDPRLEPSVQRALIAQGMISLISIPILYENEALGVINLLFDREISLNTVERETFLAIGKTIGLSIVNVRLIHQLRSEIAERQRIQSEISALNKDLENRIAQRTAELEQRTHQMEAANLELEGFSYSVSHDLRAPLRAISGFSTILLREKQANLDEEARHLLEQINTAAQQMNSLIESLLNIARLARVPLQFQEVNLSALAEDIVTELDAQDPQHKVSFHIQPNLQAQADPQLMRTVLENLLNNACKYSAKKEAPHVWFGAQEQNDQTIYYVRDNGIGFDMKYGNKLFVAFQRLHHAEEFPGHGIGLASVKRIIHRHGGQVWAESEPGRGATFYFTLPG